MKCATNSPKRNGAMVELVDTRVLGTRIARCEGSSPFRPTLTKTGDNDGLLKNCDHQQSVDKNVYPFVYDTSISSTIANMESVVYTSKLRKKNLGRGLRNQYFRM